MSNYAGRVRETYVMEEQAILGRCFRRDNAQTRTKTQTQVISWLPRMSVWFWLALNNRSSQNLHKPPETSEQVSQISRESEEFEIATGYNIDIPILPRSYVRVTTGRVREAHIFC